MSTTITALPSAVAENAGYVVVDQGSGPVATVALSVPSMQMNWMTGLDAAGNAIPTSSTTIQSKISGQGTSSGSTQSVILGAGTAGNLILGSPAVLAQLTSAAAPNSALFWSTTLAQFAWKDSGGTTHATNWI